MGKYYSTDACKYFIYKWHIRVEDIKHSVMIGIIGGELRTKYSFEEEMDYGYWSSCGQFESGMKSKDYGECLLDGDILCMELNMKDKTLRFARNGKDYGIACKNIETGFHIYYRLALCFAGKGKVSIVNFERKQAADEDEHTEETDD